MGDLGDVGTNTEITPNSGVKMIQPGLDATVDDGDSFTVDLTKSGCTNIQGIQGFPECTTAQVITTEAPTTSVSNGTLKLTVGRGSDSTVI